MLRNFPIFCGISSLFFFFAFRNYFTAEANVVATFNMWVVLPCLWTCQNSRALFFNIHEIQSSYLFICIFFSSSFFILYDETFLHFCARNGSITSAHMISSVKRIEDFINLFELIFKVQEKLVTVATCKWWATV